MKSLCVNGHLYSSGWGPTATDIIAPVEGVSKGVPSPCIYVKNCLPVSRDRSNRPSRLVNAPPEFKLVLLSGFCAGFRKSSEERKA